MQARDIVHIIYLFSINNKDIYATDSNRDSIQFSRKSEEWQFWDLKAWTYKTFHSSLKVHTSK